MEFRQIAKHRRSHVTVPPGAWFVTHNLFQEWKEDPETKLIAIGNAVRDIVLVSEQHGKRAVFERHLLWSERPFAVHVRANRSSWILLPREIGPRGITSRTIVDDVPEFIESTALPRSSKKTSCSWARLTDLALLVEREPVDLLETYLPYFSAFNDPAPGIHYLHASSEEIARQKTVFAMLSTQKDIARAVGPNPSKIWVRKRFTMTVLALEALRYAATNVSHRSHAHEARESLPSSDSI